MPDPMRDLFEPLYQAILGEDSRTGGCRIIVQSMGTMDGKASSLIVGIVLGEDLRGAAGADETWPHALVIGRIALAPLEIYGGREGVGMGLDGLVTNGGLDKRHWSRSSFHGLAVPNPYFH